ncbi:hypothetical protein NDU88_003528 [Pleurodeles waltl]|uniref:Secreted protein n=1 Tax=Pleurodeles waltl TaxID=8319 RepID=A0AAV7T6F6_PLEWA|nr:hypothetical protein NDU88_003528 [Pleurodeles waltl]
MTLRLPRFFFLPWVIVPSSAPPPTPPPAVHSLVAAILNPESQAQTSTRSVLKLAAVVPRDPGEEVTRSVF